MPASLSIPIIVVQHRARDGGTTLEELLQAKCSVRIKQADEKEYIEKGTVYVAPSGYHLLIERDRSLSLSTDANIRLGRPSIDVVFETAADVYKEMLAGIILTGANNDGAAGIMAIGDNGGVTIAQHPGDAQYSRMPLAAIETQCIQHVYSLEQIRDFLLHAGKG